MMKLRKPPRIFLLKATLLSLSIVAAFQWFAANYRIGLDFQHEKCLPGYTLFLVDLNDQQLLKNKVYAFKAQGLEPVFYDGTLMAKRYMAGPGDRVSVIVKSKVENGEKTIQGFPEIHINGEQVREGLAYAHRLNTTYEQYTGSKVLNEGEYWFLGDSVWSFDSRYWGSVNDSQVVGRAIPIF